MRASGSHGTQEPSESYKVELPRRLPQGVGVATLGNPSQSWCVDPAEVSPQCDATCVGHDMLYLLAREHLRRPERHLQQRCMLVCTVFGDRDIEAQQQLVGPRGRAGL